MNPLHQFATLLAPEDSVAVARKPIAAGTELDGPSGRVIARAPIPPGHKLALRDLPAGAPVLKYGEYIGTASRPIAAGDHVHSHNLAAGEIPPRSQEHAATEGRPAGAAEGVGTERRFQGFSRAKGRAGTRNYIAVISSVNCSASVSRYVAEAFRGEALRRDFPTVDGVLAFTHKGGCAMDPGEPTQVLQRVLAGIARHPNIGGWLMIGLGCEVNQASALLSSQGLDRAGSCGEGTPAVLNIQQAGGVRRTVEAGIAAVRRLLPVAAAHRRTPQPLSQLALAMNCGGSDGHSGCTANPALGVASDLLVAHGGTSVLAETPEIYGAEHLLARRAVSPAVRDRLLAQVRWWEDHVRLHGTTIDNNPSFGNRQGGLTTIYEKSLGAIAKGGRAPLQAVYGYAEPVTAQGFCFMDTPGYDPVSMTGLVAGGCNVAVFTTGRGSVYGCKPTPCLKVASNTPLYLHQQEDMDQNAGSILEGTATVESVGRELFEKILAAASGEPTRSELAGLGDEEFAPWALGPTL
ncbi:MAG TPA: galactonate dehydratase [Verrucomicrobiales bacterium]|nr:galactonate dehydratase [Verrucomicrobiales bacterium]